MPNRKPYIPIRTRAKFVGCRRVIRKCYHCGYAVELMVLDGVEPPKASPDDFCVSENHHKQFHNILTFQDVMKGEVENAY